MSDVKVMKEANCLKCQNCAMAFQFDSDGMSVLCDFIEEDMYIAKEMKLKCTNFEEVVDEDSDEVVEECDRV